MRIQQLSRATYVLFVIVCAVLGAPTGKPKRKGCRCKKVYKELQEAFDAKFKAFENRFTADLPNLNKIANETMKLAEYNARISKLFENVQFTQDALQRESQTLKSVRNQISEQRINLKDLNSNFAVLDAVVKNLSDVIDRLANISPLPALSNKINQLNTEPKPSIPATQPTEPTKATTLQEMTSYPKDCHEVHKSGGMKYEGDYYIMIKPDKSPKPFKVLCKVVNGTGWTVIQRRQDGSVDFYRNWQDYKTGFGNQNGEFYLGNEHIHHLTSQGDYKLRIDMEEWNGKKYYAVYDIFRTADENDNYRLHITGYHGTAGDSMTTMRDDHNGMQFSTYDRDNDKRSLNNCAVHYRGGWWYSDCFESNLNGRYYTEGQHNDLFRRNGIQWNSIHYNSSLKFVEMMIMPSDGSMNNNHI
ncbi:fibrinogen-like protein 1 [Mytilus californianus]|uniref:fibrinogen-like protein 1 n=1 Tax=Mytilus californianus TaxID=6549 RepID=UPI00224680A1|nr:fibrinogen-like protein 1 [Mytilus californianus]